MSAQIQPAHPVMGAAVEACSLPGPLSTGPLEPELAGPMTLEQAQSFAEAREAGDATAYRHLIRHLAHNAPGRGVSDISQMRPLSDADHAVIIRAHPDLTDITTLHAKVVEDVQTELDVMLEQRSDEYPLSYYGGNHLTTRERSEHECGVLGYR